MPAAADLHWRKGDGTQATIVRDEYGYDAAGNRRYARSERAGEAADQRSWLYGYDKLDRLTSAELGALSSGNDQITSSTLMPVPRQAAWVLDVLGNWTGDGLLPGLEVAGDPLTNACWPRGPHR
jgi:hypothetical protein